MKSRAAQIGWLAKMGARVSLTALLFPRLIQFGLFGHAKGGEVGQYRPAPPPSTYFERLS